MGRVFQLIPDSFSCIVKDKCKTRKHETWRHVPFPSGDVKTRGAGLHAAAVHHFVIKLFQLVLVLGLFVGQEQEQVMDGAGFGAVCQ